ncbi:hypothetical protein DFH07DRAFT_250712 [Mycena maculata]|uniref:Uncharacterized protein n=1 Tax=Mycena maculata TaxID=230809 RepID=A0AAD7MNV8_9AGAR|nr:hypothetical protein DFH07DRAFT_250712 [Mycena maculata]
MLAVLIEQEKITEKKVERCYYARRKINMLALISFMPRECKNDEHAETLERLKFWATSPVDGQNNIFWLRGPQDCGKSKIVGALCRGQANRRRCLLNESRAWRPSSNLSLLQAAWVTSSLKPLKAHWFGGLLIFLVDGIEWCRRGPGQGPKTVDKEEEVLKTVLRILIDGSTHFPPDVRLLISSRGNEGVRKLLEGCPRVKELEMEEAKPVQCKNFGEED